MDNVCEDLFLLIKLLDRSQATVIEHLIPHVLVKLYQPLGYSTLSLLSGYRYQM